MAFLTGTVKRLSQNFFSRTKAGVLEFAGSVQRLSQNIFTRTKNSVLEFAGEISSILNKIGSATGIIEFSGTAQRLSQNIFSRLRESVLEFAGTAQRLSQNLFSRNKSGSLLLSGILSKISYLMPDYISALDLSGLLTRNIITRKTVSGFLTLAGIGKRLGTFLTGQITRQVERAKTYTSGISFSGITDGVKLHIYEAQLDLYGAVLYAYQKANIFDGSLDLSGLVTYAYSFLKTTVIGELSSYGLLVNKLSLKRLQSSVLNLAGAIYYAVAEMFLSSKSGSITPSGQVRKGRNKTTSGGLFGGGGDSDFVFDKGGDFTFEDSSDFIWGSSIGIVTWILTPLRLLIGSITPSGIARRYSQIKRTKRGTITTSASVRRKLNLLRSYTGSLNLTGEPSRAAQGSDYDRLGYLTIEGLSSRLVGKLRTYAGAIAFAGEVAVSKLGINWRSYFGTLNLNASISRRLNLSRTWILTVIPANQALWFFTRLRRYLVVARTKAGNFDISGIVSWVLADRLGSVRGVFDLVGIASRSSILSRAKDGVLSFAGEAIAYMGYFTFPKPIGSLALAGSLTRSIDVTHLQLGTLLLIGTDRRQFETSRNPSGTLTFVGDWDEWREALYYGPEI